MHFFSLSKIVSLLIVTDFYRFEVTNTIVSDTNRKFTEGFLSPSHVLSTVARVSAVCRHKHSMSEVLLKFLFFTGRNLISCPSSQSLQLDEPGF